LDLNLSLLAHGKTCPIGHILSMSERENTKKELNGEEGTGMGEN